MMDWFGIWNPMALFPIDNVDSVIKEVQQTNLYSPLEIFEG